MSRDAEFLPAVGIVNCKHCKDEEILSVFFESEFEFGDFNTPASLVESRQRYWLPFQNY
jgi:hypothetical protein